MEKFYKELPFVIAEIVINPPNCRYEYDDHYFLTDPKEFIYEFYPLQPEWQLLNNIITLSQFEDLPFVRSLFFRYQLSFPGDLMKSVMVTDMTGKHGCQELGCRTQSQFASYLVQTRIESDSQDYRHIL